MTDLETMLAVAGNSGDPADRLALAGVLEEAGDKDTADRQRALAELLARHGSKFTTVTVAREWREGGPENRYRVLLVADGRCYATGSYGLTPADPNGSPFWSGPSGEMWVARADGWHHGYGCTQYDPDDVAASVDHLDFLADSPEDVIAGLMEYRFQPGCHVLVYLSGEPCKETHWFRFDGETWQEIDPAIDPQPDLAALGGTAHDIRP